MIERQIGGTDLENIGLAIAATLETISGGSHNLAITRWQSQGSELVVHSENGRKSCFLAGLPVALQIEIAEEGILRTLTLKDGLTQVGLAMVNERLEKRGKKQCTLVSGISLSIASQLNSPTYILADNQENELDSDLEEALIFTLGLWRSRTTYEEIQAFRHFVDDSQKVDQLQFERKVVHNERVELVEAEGDIVPADRPLTDAQELANLLRNIDWAEDFIPNQVEIRSDMKETLARFTEDPLGASQAGLTCTERYCAIMPGEPGFRWIPESSVRLGHPDDFFGKELTFSMSMYTNLQPRVIRTKEKRTFTMRMDSARVNLEIMLRKNGEVIVGSFNAQGEKVVGAIVLRGEKQLNNLRAAFKQYCARPEVFSRESDLLARHPRRPHNVMLDRLLDSIRSRAKLLNLEEPIDLARVEWLLAALTWPGQWTEKMRLEVGNKVGSKGLKSEDEVLQAILTELAPVVWHLGETDVDQLTFDQGEWWKMFAGDVGTRREKIYKRKCFWGIPLNFHDWQATLPGVSSLQLPSGK